jgi:hypothetical protein
MRTMYSLQTRLHRRLFFPDTVTFLVLQQHASYLLSDFSVLLEAAAAHAPKFERWNL